MWWIQTTIDEEERRQQGWQPTSCALTSNLWPFPGDSTTAPVTDTEAPVDSRSTSEYVGTSEGITTWKRARKPAKKDMM